MPDDLPEKMRSRAGQRSESVVSVSNLTLDELEKEYLLKVLEETGWHKKRAASILGINASTLYRKLQRYGFEKAVGAMRAPENLVGAAKSDD
jgi:DNA-binding NtrC family response regulator